MDPNQERVRRGVVHRYLAFAAIAVFVFFVLPERESFIEWRLTSSFGKVIALRLGAVAVGAVFCLLSMLAARRVLDARDAVPAHWFPNSEPVVRRVAWATYLVGAGALLVGLAFAMFHDLLGFLGFTAAALIGLIAVGNEALWIRRLERTAGGPTSAST